MIYRTIFLVGAALLPAAGALSSSTGIRRFTLPMMSAGDAPATSTPAEVTSTPSAGLYDPLGKLSPENSEDMSLAEMMNSSADIKRIHADADRFFDQIDVNADGAVSMSEMRSHLASVGYDEGSVDKIYALLDLNDDGELSREEMRESFVKYDDPALRLALGLGTSEADQIFDQVDVNGDGEISQAELTVHMLNTGYPNPEGTAQTIFKTLDIDGDGTVSRAELREGWVKYSALREALGLGGNGRTSNAAKNPKGAPKRWGRGRKKNSGMVLAAKPTIGPEDFEGELTEEQRERLQPIHSLKRVRKSPPIR